MIGNVHSVDTCQPCGKPVINGETRWTTQGTKVPPRHPTSKDCVAAPAQVEIGFTNDPPNGLGVEGAAGMAGTS